MLNNVAGWDRVARVVLGLGVLALAFVGPKTPWAFLGAIFVVTGFVGFCPIYRVIGRGTKRPDAPAS